MNIKVASLRKLSPELGYTDVRCDRSSVLGNPFSLEIESQRDAVIQAYRVWLWANLKTYDFCNGDSTKFNSAISQDAIALQFGLKLSHTRKSPTVIQVVLEIDRLSKIKNLRLLCWCSPRKCHGDVIKSCLIWWKEKTADG